MASLEKATNDDTQSEDRRGLLMKAERSETRAQKMEQQVRIYCDYKPHNQRPANIVAAISTHGLAAFPCSC